jgi:hypothetical protein
MSIQSAYRRMPGPFAVPLAVLASGVGALALAALGVLMLDFLLERFHRPGGLEGPGAGVLAILVALNIAVSAFVAMVSVLVNLHHRTSWPTPTLAFAFCSVMVGVWAPFRMDVRDLLFEPFVLGTGAISWLASCWLLRRRLSTHSKHVIEA